MNSDERNALVLGALLHDVGKFYQRTGLPAAGYEEFTSDDYGRNGAHAKWSASFVEQYVPERWRGAGSTALYHHKPKDRLAELVAQADGLSSGIDREKRGEELGSIEFDRQACVLEQVSIPKKPGEERRAKQRNYAYPLLPLALREEAIFPGQFPRVSLKEEYKDLWVRFTKEVERIQGITHFDAYLESLYYLLWKYTWCVPSAVYVDYPDIPLFDHLRATAAIAACLYDTEGRPEFRLIEGDLSGIQNFIYGTASPTEAQRGMAKRLRGKSFYLSLLTRTLADYFATSLGLPLVNILWQGGGHFAILAPDDSKTEGQLGRARAVVEEFLWQEFQGEIGLAVGEVRASGEDLKDFGRLLGRMGYTLGCLKTQKQRFLLSRPSEWQFPFKGEVCPLCQRDVEQLERDSEEPDRQLCDQCRHFEEIGGMIPHTRRLIRVRSGEEVFPGDGRTVSFGDLGIQWRLEAIQRIPETGTGIGVFALADSSNVEFQFLPDGESLLPTCSYGFEIIANVVKTEGRRILEFDELADLSRGGFLGTLRMDVDDLGAVFSLGFGQEERSLSRLANLSRSLDLFFSGYLNQLAADRNVYVAYAGGDDLFITGAWNEVVDLAEEIQEKFSAYCAHNPDLHISGGIYLSKGRFPIGRAAEYAGERLERAKGGDEQGQKKNALVLFEQRVSWETFGEIKKWADAQLIPAIEKEEVSRKFFYFLLGLYHQHLEPERQMAERNQRKEDLVWIPKLLYSLARNVEDKELCVELQQEVVRLKEHIPILVSYIGLMTRSKERR